MLRFLGESIRSLEVSRRLNNIFGPARHKFYDDDFNWETYTAAKYEPQIKRLEKLFTLHAGTDVQFDESAKKLSFETSNLHPNAFTIYELIGILGAKTVFEVGCGAGDHLRNIKQIYPSVGIAGGDRSPEQLRLLARRNPEVGSNCFQQDITMPYSSRWPQSELVFSQTVIMHIKTAVSHLNALSNMFKMASHYVVLSENFGCHPFVEDIKLLHEGGYIDWKQVHFHTHNFMGNPHCLVVSRDECCLPKLTDYSALPYATKKRFAA
jgi:SAM-dependent methyltransferase